jgi:hypothetical protein
MRRTLLDEFGDIGGGSGTTSPGRATPSRNPNSLNRHPLANQPDFRQIRRAVELGHYADVKHQYPWNHK